MARYIDADLLLEEVENNIPLNWTDSEVEKQVQFDFQVFKHIIGYQPTADVAPKSEVIEEYRKKVYSKMEKYTVFGREYIQRIMREAEKEMVGEKDA